MAEICVCENHPRRARVVTFTYVDADGITYVSHYCPECAELEVEEGLYEWVLVSGGFRFEQRRVA